MMDASAAFRIEQRKIYSQYKVPVVIVKVWSPDLVFYISVIYNKYHEMAGFAFCNKAQVSK